MAEPTKAAPLQAVKGMNDILPPESAHWEWLEAKLRALMQRYGYADVRTPIVEPTPLFERGLGDATDVVEKEMYSFVDSMNGDPLTLRPENTAGVARAAAEHNVLYDGGKRLFYIGPMFRHERPQKGRYRQFHQFGVEALGYAGPDIDAEQILMCRAMWRELGLAEGQDITLELNSLGHPTERHAHREALIAHFGQHAELLDDNSRSRLHRNPLRLLDSKHPPMQALIDSAPRLIDHLGADSLAHLDAVRRVLDAAGLAYRVNPRLVRGLDYYNLTVFEWTTPHLGAQATVCGGGRYDFLMERIGGKPAPAVGFALGIERLLLLLGEMRRLPGARVPDAYAVVPSVAVLAPALLAIEALRAAGVSVVMHAASAAGWGSMKSQFKRADSSGARYALVFGDSEVAQGQVAVKPLRDAAGTQVLRPLDRAAEWAAELRAA